MELHVALEKISYKDICNTINFTSEKELDQLKHFYIKAETNLNYPKSVINAAVIYALRVNDNSLPTNNYLEKTLLNNFKFCKTAVEASTVLLNRIVYESELSNKTSKIKKESNNQKDKNPHWINKVKEELENEAEL